MVAKIGIKMDSYDSLIKYETVICLACSWGNGRLFMRK